MDERLAQLPTEALLERLASGDPAPGGGSAAALAGAVGASLLHMVVELTSGRPAAAEHEATLTDIRAMTASTRSDLLRLVDLDAAAYESVARARRLPRDTERERQARTVQIATATQEATRAPLATARRTADVLSLAERLAPIGNRNAISDVGVGGLLAAAALRGAALNVRINLPYLAGEDPLRREADAEIRRLLDGLGGREAALRAAVEGRLH